MNMLSAIAKIAKQAATPGNVAKVTSAAKKAASLYKSSSSRIAATGAKGGVALDAGPAIKALSTAAAKVSKNKGVSLTAGRAVNMAKELTGAASVQRGISTMAKPGILNKIKGVAGIGAGALGLKWTVDTLTGVASADDSSSSIADDPFQAESGLPSNPMNPDQQPTNRAPAWDAPDILPDFIETRLENTDPRLLAAGGVGLVGGAAVGAKLLKNYLGRGKGSKSKDRSMEALAKEWNGLSAATKRKYENKFSDYVKVKREGIAAKTTSSKKRTPRKTTRKTSKRSTSGRKRSSAMKAQQLKMKAAAKEWKSYKGSMSYREFISKKLRK